MDKIKSEILNYRIFLKVSFVWVFGSPFRVAASHCSAKWAQMGRGLAWNKGGVRITLNMILIGRVSNQKMVLWNQVSVPSFLEGLFEELNAAVLSCQLSQCPAMGLQCPLCKQTHFLTAVYTIRLDYGLGQEQELLCSNKKIAGISLMANKEQHDRDRAVLGLPWLRSPVRQSSRTQENKWKMVLLPPPTTGATIESWRDPELALAEL